MLAVQGAYVSLTLARSIVTATGLRRRGRLAAAALVLGVGIWTMHFVGMLALRLPVPVNYDPVLTLVSALAAILAVGISFALAAAWVGGRRGILFASLAMGLGIVVMHYIGMDAMRLHASMSHEPAAVLLSVAVAIGASFLSLWLTFGPGRKPPLIAAATAMALAISGMHYTAMWATEFAAMHAAGPASLVDAPSAIPSDMLAFVVALVAFVISGVFLLTLVPDGAQPDSVGAAPERAPAEPDAAPLAEAVDDADGIPAQRNGVVVTLRQDDIVSVEADAHYTHLFDGRDTYFCSLSISEVERRLDSGRFIRVHRSHIVRKEAIAIFQRDGSHGRVRLSCDPPREVPVSRGRVPVVQQALSV
jgi:NO-binding membrane sensor protein with MHYT domain